MASRIRRPRDISFGWGNATVSLQTKKIKGSGATNATIHALWESTATSTPSAAPPDWVHINRIRYKSD